MIFDFNHLRNANIRYFHHAFRVAKVSVKLILLGIAGLIHGILPFALVETVSKGVKDVAEELSQF